MLRIPFTHIPLAVVYVPLSHLKTVGSPWAYCVAMLTTPTPRFLPSAGEVYARGEAYPVSAGRVFPEPDKFGAKRVPVEGKATWRKPYLPSTIESSGFV